MPKARLKHFLILVAAALAVPGLALARDAGRLAQQSAATPAPTAEGATNSPVVSREWIVAPGESPLSLARLLYPGEPAVQRRFIRRLADANPHLAIDAEGRSPLPVGAPLRTPDWRTLGVAESVPPAPAVSRKSLAKDTAPRPVPPVVDAPPEALPAAAPRPKAASGAASGASYPAPATAFELRPAFALAPRGEVSASMRDMLRLEYRLLRSVDDLTARLPSVENDLPPALRADTEPVQAAPSVPVESAAAVPASPVTPTAAGEAAPAVAPVKIRQLAPEQTLPAAAPAAFANTRDMLYFAGAAVSLLLALLLVSSLRRRRAALPSVTTFDLAQTVMLDHPPSRPAVPAAAAGESSAAPDAAVDIVLDAHDSGGGDTGSAGLPSLSPPETVGVNPVMELAEIMLSFGRREGAVQTLQEYIEANPKEALHPWVKLLEIYREGGMRSEFDELARQLNSNFNVEVQQWDEAAVPPSTAVNAAADGSADEAALAKALTLEDVPHIREQIVAQWGQPACLDYLHRLLHDNRGGQRSGFTLPVVQEILLLIDVLVAREAEGSRV